MISRQETARALLTPGEVMQLPPDDELVLVAGAPPIRAKKVRYFEDARLQRRVLPAPGRALPGEPRSPSSGLQFGRPDDWSDLPTVLAPRSTPPLSQPTSEGEGGLRWEAEPDAPDCIAPDVVAPMPAPEPEILPDDDTDDLPALQARFRRVARQAALDPDDGLGL